MTCGIVSLSGCGGEDDDNDSPESFTTQILSDARFDSDIEQMGPNTFTA